MFIVAGLLLGYGASFFPLGKALLVMASFWALNMHSTAFQIRKVIWKGTFSCSVGT
mgnify:CR=1 FL=1